MPTLPTVMPLLAAALLAGSLALPMGAVLAAVCALALIGAVIAAVHHAEVVAHRVSEPFGTLVLAVAITVIEVALIVSMMLAGGPDTATLPRDTIYAAVMIICTGVVGICLLAGGLSHHEQTFRLEGANGALSALVALTGLSLVLGLPPKDLVLLALTFLVGAITLGTGRTNMMQGAVHLVLFAAFLFLSMVP